MKKMLKNVLTGKFYDIMKIRTPARVHCPKTYLHAIAYDWTYIQELLLLCQEKGKLNDPVEVLKYLTAAVLGALHVGIKDTGLHSPLNPVLGETLCMETERGSILYAEQTCHHPPISHF